MTSTNQKVVTSNPVQDRITSRYLWEEVLGTLSWEKGFFFTAKALLLRPGNTIRAYLLGERKRYSNPIRFLVFITAIVTFTVVKLDLFGKLYEDAGVWSSDEQARHTQEGVIAFLYQYYNVITFLSIPFLALFSYLFFKRKSYNYAEHLVLNTFLFAEGMLIYLGIMGGLYYYPTLANVIYQATWLAYFSWGVLSFLQEKRWHGIVKVILICLFNSVALILIGGVIAYILLSHQA